MILKMDNFFDWGMLGSFAGAAAATGIITQAVKGTFQKIPTQLVSYIIAIIILGLATAATGVALDWTVWALVPLIYYLAFATIGFVLNWDFGNGLNYPYFFLNWTSPAGVFGFGGGGEYFMGTFWWILVMIALVSGIALAYAAILKRVRGGAAGKAATETEVVVGDAANDAETQEDNVSEDGSNADKDRQ